MQRTEFGNNLITGQATHAGMTGKHNEDFFGLFAWKADDQRDLYLGVVADGVGGQTAGEVASHLTVNTIEKYFDQQESIDDVNHHLERAILIANRAVYQATQENSEYQGMSTTVAIGAILNGRLYTAHVGDSRLYLLRDGELQQLSVDHTWAQEAIEAGLLTPQEAKVHPNRNVIRRHLGGGSNIEVDHRMALPIDGVVEASEANQGTSLKPGDTLLICSDGLSDMISDEAILETLQGKFQDLPAASKELVDKANQAGGKDNITVVLLQVPGKAAPAAAISPPASTVAAGTAAAGKPSAAAPTPATAAPAAKTGMGKMTWFLIGAAGLLLLVLIAAGLVFIISNSLRSESTPAPTATSTTVSPDETLPAGAPATAAILATAESGSGTEDSSSQVETPGLIPTLRSTATPTRIRRATSTATSPPTAAATATSSATSGGSSGSSTGSSGSDSDQATSEAPPPEPPPPEPPPPEPPPPEPPPPEPPPPDPEEDSSPFEPAPVEPGE